MAFIIISQVAKAIVMLFLSGLALTIIVKLLTGEIAMRGLFYTRAGDGQSHFSPERVQMLVITILVAMQYLSAASKTLPRQMPSVPDAALGVFGASQALYLTGKALAVFRPGKQ